jgi:fructokinase
MDPLASARIIGIGELLWDLFPDGRRLGGAPFNVIAGLRRLGHAAAFVTAVGDDELGRDALAAARDLGVDATFVAVSPDLPTGTVGVTPDPVSGHRFEIRSPAAYESIGDGSALAARVEAWEPDALVFGTLAHRFPGVRSVTDMVASGGSATHRLYDVNLREGCWSPALVLQLLPLATIVKVNATEAATLAGIVGCEDDPGALGRRLAADHGVHILCVTRGAGGAVLWADDELLSVDAIAIDVADTVGAGDAFAAGLLHGVLTGLPYAEALAFANRLAALVASRPGALPDWQADEIAAGGRGAPPG